ncbi:MAG: sugar ABC transporter ATP-binding protein [Clostridiaceae bacterium]|nr:sugar ABC transporter ATP-binding protein [Clostridiaceae bacterium]
MHKTVLEMKNIWKSFSGNVVLRDVNFTVRQGEVHGILGENGAGKSTLMKILMGIYSKDSGTLLLDGEEIDINSPKQALELGISMIHQELNPVLDLSIAENVFLGKEITKYGLVQYKEMQQQALEIIERVGLSVPTKQTMRGLSIAQMQQVEIAKALSWNAKVMIMDEPTASLTEREIDALFLIIRQMTEKGISVIYITHKIEELFRICNRVTVLRNGEYIATEEISETSRDHLISLMVGREIGEIYPKEDVDIGEVVFEVENLSVTNVLSDISFKARRGEILGVAGLVGAGRSELMETIFGLRTPSSGQIKIHGEPISILSPRTALKNKMAFVTEDRKVTGLNLIAPLRENITLVTVRQFVEHMRINKKKETEASDLYIDRLGIKTDTCETQVKDLSGGNQQKVVIAKWLLADPDIIIMDEPTRGIDVGAKRDIYLLMGELVKQGKTIILISSEMPEVLGMSDRIMVLSGGKVMGVLNRNEFEQQKIMDMQFGAVYH